MDAQFSLFGRSLVAVQLLHHGKIEVHRVRHDEQIPAFVRQLRMALVPLGLSVFDGDFLDGVHEDDISLCDRDHGYGFHDLQHRWTLSYICDR